MEWWYVFLKFSIFIFQKARYVPEVN